MDSLGVGDYDDGRASNRSTLGSQPSTPTTTAASAASLGDSPPEQASDGSRGSSVSSVQDEYDDAIRYAQIRPFLRSLLKGDAGEDDVVATPRASEPAKVAAAAPRSPAGSRPRSAEPSVRKVHGYGPAAATSGMATTTTTTTTTTLEEEVEVSALDDDISKLEGELDTWCGTLKKAVLAEFSHTKVRLLQRNLRRIEEERRSCNARLATLQAECASLREHAHASGQSLKSRELVMERLLALMKAQRDSGTARAAFDRWRQQHTEAQREGYAARLADQHHRRAVLRRAFEGWHGVIKAGWRERAERACQARAEEVCRVLTIDYEEKLAVLRSQLDSAREEIGVLHRQQEEYNEKMKKAFMRGVCALNMEAMSMFRGGAPQELPAESAPMHSGPAHALDAEAAYHRKHAQQQQHQQHQQHQQQRTVSAVSYSSSSRVPHSRDEVHSHATTAASSRVVIERHGTHRNAGHVLSGGDDDVVPRRSQPAPLIQKGTQVVI